MNRKRDTYDRIAVGERIRKKRVQLGMSQDELAEKIDRAPKYCSDIERGICGMSIETMISLSYNLDISLDYIIFGSLTEDEIARQNDDQLALLHILSKCNDRQRLYAIKLLKLFLASMEPNNSGEEKRL